MREDVFILPLPAIQRHNDSISFQIKIFDICLQLDTLQRLSERKNEVINPEIIAYANDRIALEIDEQEKQLSIEIIRIQAEMNSRGMLRSGKMIVTVQAACVRAVNERADFVWQILHRGITTIGIVYEDDVEQQLKKFVEWYFPENMNRLGYRVSEVAQQFGMADIVTKIPNEVQNTRNTALAKIFSEIRLFVLTLKKTPAPETYTPQLNIYNSHIGSVQTGHNSVSNVNMQINAESRDAIKSALDEIAQKLTIANLTPGQSKEELIELVNDSKHELSKEKPNLTKISSYLQGIGTSIGVVANLKPAYDSLKTAAALIGINLP